MNSIFNAATPNDADSTVAAGDHPFVHLHLHSQYSLLDGGNRLDRLIARVKELGMPAVAVTDHGNLFGAMDFYAKAKDAGIKPILGIEAYVAPDIDGKPSDRTNKEYTGVQDGGFHLVLLAENNTGWQHLLKLASDAYLTGFYYKPRMDKTTLRQWADGLIAINGHLGSSIAHHLTRFHKSNDPRHWQSAIDEAKWHVETFGVNERGEPRFYIELQRHDTPEQLDINPLLVKLADELNLPLVADNDAHFLLEEDYDMHDTLCCIAMGKTKDDPNRLHYPRQLFVKSPQQMWQAFLERNSEVPPDKARQALHNTAAIAQRCDVQIDFNANHAPVVKVVSELSPLPTDADAALRLIDALPCEHPVGSTEWYEAFCGRFQLLPYDTQRDTESAEELKHRCDGALRVLTEAGAIWRYGRDGIDQTKRARIERELQVLADKHISAYFLIVWDFVNEARRRGIPANARGSGVGTMVGYCLGLSNACPVQYGLLFERFTDPDRSEYPDIDIDMCQDGRQPIIDYVRQKYGYVAQIITFNILKARAAVRDVGRVLGVPIPEVDKVCKLIGDGLGVTIDQAVRQEPELKKLIETSESHQRMIDTARKLEGMARHHGVHAAGVIVATEPLENIVPLCKASGKGNGNEQIVTQWDGPTCEKVGLLKMDFLGLRTLSIINRARQLIRQSLDKQTIHATVHGPDAAGKADDLPDPLELERLRYDDPKVLDLFSRGETAGVFQFESGGMRNLLMAMKPDRLEDLIAANALYRPGPMDLIPDYNDRKHQRKQVPPVHPIVDRLTAETYGIMVYQEQVMQVANELGGIPLRQAYSLIKAISKKKENIINANREQFLQGAQKQGLARAQAEELFDLILKFAGYGFNKSHSTGYAIVAYQTAYLKTYFPVHYMAALLTYESVSTEKVVAYIGECKRVQFPDGRRGIDVRPPDINHSDIGFTVVFDNDEPRDANHGHIRFGLSAVKGVGNKAIHAILEEREKKGPFTSLYDFCERVPLGAVNRATIEALIKCGAFDQVHGIEQRAAMVQALDAAIQAGQRAASDRNSGQMSFFGSFAQSDSANDADDKADDVRLPATEPWNTAQQLEFEKEVLGFYVSSHPLDEHQPTIRRFSSCTLAGARTLPGEVPVVVGGMIKNIRTPTTRKGDKMAIVTIEDGHATMEAVLWPETYATNYASLQSESTINVVFLKGKLDRKREDPQIIVEQVIPLDKAAQMLTSAVRIVIEDRKPREQGCSFNGELDQLKQVLTQASRHHHGPANAAILLELHQDGYIVTLRLDGVRVHVDQNLLAGIQTVLNRHNSGKVRCELIGPEKINPAHRHGKSFATQDNITKGKPQAAMPMRSSRQAGACASIDRY